MQRNVYPGAALRLPQATPHGAFSALNALRLTFGPVARCTESVRVEDVQLYGNIMHLLCSFNLLHARIYGENKLGARGECVLPVLVVVAEFSQPKARVDSA